MQRDYSPLENCRECGQVVRMLIHERSLNDEGESVQSIWAETYKHSKRECERMVALYRETWPTLW